MRLSTAFFVPPFVVLCPLRKRRIRELILLLVDWQWPFFLLVSTSSYSALRTPATCAAPILNHRVETRFRTISKRILHQVK